MSKTLDIVNILGDAPKALADRVEAYFDKEKAPVPSVLGELNDLVGFPYQLNIDWREFYSHESSFAKLVLD